MLQNNMETNVALATNGKPIEEGIKDWAAVIETLERIQNTPIV
jgi:hypothetical protein